MRPVKLVNSAPNCRHVCPVDSAQRHGFLSRLLSEKKRGVGTSTPDLLQCQLLGRIGQGLATAGRTGKVTGRPPPTAVRPGVGSDATPVAFEPAEGGSQEHPSPPIVGKSPGPLSYPHRVHPSAEIGGAWDERADAGTAVLAGRWAHPALQRWVAGAGGTQKESSFSSQKTERDLENRRVPGGMRTPWRYVSASWLAKETGAKVHRALSSFLDAAPCHHSAV